MCLNKSRVLKALSENTLNYFHNVIALQFALSLLELEKLMIASHILKISSLFFKKNPSSAQSIFKEKKYQRASKV